MPSGSSPCPRGCLLRTHVEKLDSGGIALTVGGGQRIFLPWALLGLAEAPANSNGDSWLLRWRLHCVDPESGTREFFSGDRNRWTLAARQGRPIAAQAADLRTGVLDVELRLERRAVLDVLAAPSRQVLPMRLQLAEPLSVCLEHRQPWDKGACCLCGQGLARRLRERSPPDLFRSTSSYAARWGAMVELEAASSAIESNDSRFLSRVYVNWEPKQEGGRQRGSFSVPVALARAHKLKFRGLLTQGGESASGWLCMREATAHNDGGVPWSGHSRIVAAGVLGEGAELGLDDEDNLKSIDGRRSITIVFELLDEVSDSGIPAGDFLFVEYIQKALSHSMQHTALAEVNPAPAADGSAPKPLLARDVVLNRLPATSAVDPANLDQWNLNSSQDQAVRRALARPMMLVHGPPGTGKTRTAAILMTLLAQRNLGARCAMLFAAPTNKACDAALHSTNRLCQGHFAERLRARVEDDGEADCAICLDGAPDIVTACGHVFHRACVARALQQSSKCPICRQVLKQHGGGLRVLRVYGADSEREDFPVPRRVDHKGIQTFKSQTVPVEMRRYTLHWRCHAAVEGEEPSAEAVRTREAYERLRATSVRASGFDERRAEYYDALTKARAVEVHQSDIIFTTCVSARRLALLAALEADGAPELRQVVLDEAGQAPEPEALCPLAVARKARQAVFFGDHKQLRPILRSRIAEEAGLGISMFERLATQDWGGHGEPPVALLAQQYRMHPAISHFPRQRFYGGRVFDDGSVLSRAPGLLAHPGTGDQSALLLWDSSGCGGGGQEQLQRVRTVGAGGVGSRSNIEEANRAASLATALAREAGEKSVAVLSWYNSQVAKVSEILRRSGLSGVHVGSIATAQGSEWDYVILSAVRSGGGGGSLGLVADPHNLNVALTRAKLGLVILCDTSAVQRDSHWNALISRCSSDHLVLRERPVVRTAPRSTASTGVPAHSPQMLPSPASVSHFHGGQGQVIPPPPAPYSTRTQLAASSPPVPPAPMVAPQLLPARGYGVHGQGPLTRTPGFEYGRNANDMVYRGSSLEMQLATILTIQSQSQLQRCACGNFANPMLDGLCNTCSSQVAYMPCPMRLGSASLMRQPPFPPAPSALPSSSLVQEAPAEQAASAVSTRPMPPQAERERGVAAPAQEAPRQVFISDTSRSPSDRAARRQPHQEPKSRVWRPRQCGSQGQVGSREHLGESTSSDERPRRARGARSPASAGSGASSRRSSGAPRGLCKRPRSAGSSGSAGRRRRRSSERRRRREARGDESSEAAERASGFCQSARRRRREARGDESSEATERASGFCQSARRPNTARGSSDLQAQDTGRQSAARDFGGRDARLEEAAGSAKGPSQRRGARNALFSYRPVERQARKVSMCEEDNPIRGG